MRPLKLATTYAWQIQRLREYGVVIDDAVFAQDCLRSMNYYRLSGYDFQFKDATKDRFASNIRFEELIRLYQFDHDLRLALFGALEVIEIDFKTQVAYYFSHKYGVEGYYNAQNFSSAKYHGEFINSLADQIDKNKDSLFVKHHFKEYGGKFPLWVAVELLSFSNISMLYKNMKDEDRETVAATYNTKEWYLVNHMHCLSVLRNICAHYARLYNREISPKIKLGNLRKSKIEGRLDDDKVFAFIITMLRYLPTRLARQRLSSILINIIDEYSDVVELNRIGAPDDYGSYLVK